MSTLPVEYRIPEIRPRDFIHCVRGIYDVLDNRNVSKSVDDPFMRAILTRHSKLSEAEWRAAEQCRLKQKALEMKVGYFHEELMGKFIGYETLPNGHVSGCDVQKLDGTVIIEVKNRNNTVKGSDGKHIIERLKKLRCAGVKAIFAQVNCESGKVSRYGAPPEMDIWDGRQVYAFLSGRASFFDDLQRTLEWAFTMDLHQLQCALGVAAFEPGVHSVDDRPLTTHCIHRTVSCT